MISIVYRAVKNIMQPDHRPKTVSRKPQALAPMPARPIPLQIINVLGFGNNGKTSLLRALASEPFIENSPTTWGLRQSIGTLRAQPVLVQDFQGQNETLQIQSLGGALKPPGMILHA